jgi:hypothetical protein
MPRRNANTRTERYDRAPGRYPLGELTDVSPLEELAARFQANRRAMRMVHGR